MSVVIQEMFLGNSMLIGTGLKDALVESAWKPSMPLSFAQGYFSPQNTEKSRSMLGKSL